MRFLTSSLILALAFGPAAQAAGMHSHGSCKAMAAVTAGSGHSGDQAAMAGHAHHQMSDQETVTKASPGPTKCDCGCNCASGHACSVSPVAMVSPLTADFRGSRESFVAFSDAVHSSIARAPPSPPPNSTLR